MMRTLRHKLITATEAVAPSPGVPHRAVVSFANRFLIYPLLGENADSITLVVRALDGASPVAVLQAIGTLTGGALRFIIFSPSAMRR